MIKKLHRPKESDTLHAGACLKFLPTAEKVMNFQFWVGVDPWLKCSYFKLLGLKIQPNSQNLWGEKHQNSSWNITPECSGAIGFMVCPFLHSQILESYPHSGSQLCKNSGFSYAFALWDHNHNYLTIFLNWFMFSPTGSSDEEDCPSKMNIWFALSKLQCRICRVDRHPILTNLTLQQKWW